MKLENQLLKGTFWSIIEVVIRRAWDLILKLILARLLLPSDFGLVGMCTVFISITQVLNDAGISVSLIQRNRNELNKKDLNTAFWTGIIWSLLLYLIVIFLVTPFAASFYNEPKISYFLPILSIPLLISPLNGVHKAQLVRALNFKKTTFINNVSGVVAGVLAVLFAYLGFGVWALVVDSLVSAIVSVPLFFYSTRWFPKFEWSTLSFKRLFSFGFFVTCSQLLTVLSANSDYLIIGKFLDSSKLGVYSLAYMFTALVRNQITSVVNRVMYPFYSSIQDNLSKITSYYLKLINYYCLATSFFMLNIALFSELLIKTLFGEKWILAIVPMKILAIAMTIDVLTSGYNLLFRSIGKPHIELLLVFTLTLIFNIPLIFLGVTYKGVVGAAFGILLSKILTFILIQTILKFQFKINFYTLLLSLKKTILLVVTSVSVTLLLRSFSINDYVLLVVFNTIYLLASIIQLKPIISLILNKIKWN